MSTYLADDGVWIVRCDVGQPMFVSPSGELTARRFAMKNGWDTMKFWRCDTGGHEMTDEVPE